MDHGCNYGLGEKGGGEKRERLDIGDYQVVIVGTGEDSSWQRTESLLSKGSGRGVQTSG